MTHRRSSNGALIRRHSPSLRCHGFDRGRAPLLQLTHHFFRREADAARDKAVEEAAMSEDTKHTPQHPKFISLEDDCDIDYWAGKFAVTRDRLAAAVGRVGHSAEALERYLKRG
jgi:hypothetical protein